MIIGIDASRANAATKSGTELVAWHLIQEFKKMADPRDRYILYSKEPLEGALSDLPDNFSSRVLGWPPKFLWTQIRLAWEMVVRPPDVLFIPAHTIPIIHPKKTYTILHDVGFEYFSDLYSKKTIGYSQPFLKSLLHGLVRIFTLGKYGASEIDYHRWSARFAIRHAAKIITVSEFSRQEIIKCYKPADDKVVVFHNAFDTSYRKIDNVERIRRVLDTYHITKPYLLFIGRLETKKNTARLIEAFTRFKHDASYPGKLVLVGKPGFGYEEVKKKIAEQQIADSIIEPGWIERDDLPAIMNGADAFVFPSLYEGFGMPILEAMNCGIPVVTSNRGATAEVAGEAAILVNPEDEISIANGIKQAVNDTDVRGRLIAQGYERAHSFDWHTAAKDYLRLLASN